MRTAAWKREAYRTNDLRKHRHEGGESIGVAAGRDRDAVFIVVRLDGGEHKVRKHEQAEGKGKDDDDKKKKDPISFDIVVKSPYLRDVCREAMAGVHGISWVSEPLEVRSSRRHSRVRRLILIHCSCTDQHKGPDRVLPEA